MDIKTPGSGEAARNLMSNLGHLKSTDQLKFVICDRQDYEWSKAFCGEHRLLTRCAVLFSPSQGALEPRELAEWILADRLQVRFQVQLHKYLWGDAPGH
jgi:7-carboxy-7-deazaguanine synthase